jgi:polyketide cyclase/dehydrase/lipid transport protein
MAKLDSTIEIAASPADVFVFFVPQRMAYWYGKEMDGEIDVHCGAPEFCLSQAVRITGKLGKKEVAHTAVITRYEWGRLLEWRFEDSYGVRGLERWEIQAANGPGSGTHVHMRSEYELPGKLGRAVDWVFTRHAVARRNYEYLARLKKLAERA